MSIETTVRAGDFSVVHRGDFQTIQILLDGEELCEVRDDDDSSVVVHFESFSDQFEDEFRGLNKYNLDDFLLALAHAEKLL